MLSTKRRVLIALAALAWASGGIVLLLKGTGLAWELGRFETAWARLAPPIGIGLGVLKVKYLFNRFCARNLERIAALEQPRIWQFFRPGFFLFLGTMMVLGATLSRLALEHFGLLVGMVILDFSLATALLGSMPVFFRHPREAE